MSDRSCARSVASQTRWASIIDAYEVSGQSDVTMLTELVLLQFCVRGENVVACTALIYGLKVRTCLLTKDVFHDVSFDTNKSYEHCASKKISCS